ncbi:related to repellent protein 1 precursor [Melanopsichium pennsylvanicum]|uniref:Related to repellent protein 1 n=2 Tax=Melanopsichium pennsylvanicum TaxID=63383 RepID=A0AAJ4XP91_9BASI|nr:repellent protein 1 precursor [Melanopsichium pennsylvanicum 4]SNX85818.1 related to repellent protein 1 precursor [Melanopsichium pennsylvanicum]
MPSKIALSISVLTAALGMVNAAPHYEFKSHNGGHNVQSTSENKLIDLSKLGLNVDLLKRTDYSVCKKYISSYNGGHNVYSVNENKLIDLSDATIDISLLSNDGRKQKTWSKAPRYCLEYIQSYNGGHNVVVDNENKLIDLSGLNLDLDILKRNGPEFEYYNGGHNVESTNENKLIDVSDLLANVDILKRKAPSFSSYNGGHNVESDNDNKLLDLSNLLANVDVLKKRTNAEYSYYNGGHNVESTTENKLIDLSDLLANVDILKKRNAPEFSYYNGGHNVASSSENKLIDVSDLTALVNVLSKRHAPEVEYYNGGHNVESTSESKLIDLSDLTALVNVLSKRSLKGYGSKIRARDISESLYRRTNDDEDCTCVKKPKPQAPKQTSTQPPRGNNGGNGGNGGNSGNSGDCDATPTSTYKPQPPHTHKANPTTSTDKPQPPHTHKANPTTSTDKTQPPHTHKANPTTSTDKPSLLPTTTTLPTTSASSDKPSPSAKATCGSEEVYVDEGHNVVSKSSNKLVDLSNINIQISILDGLLGSEKKDKTVSADSVCTSKQGCCVSKSVYYYNGGHNVESTNENKGIDLSGLDLGLNILK